MTNYRSKFEREFAQRLKKAKLNFKYEATRLSYVKTHYYVPDFLLGPFYVETKGRFTSSDRAKLLAVRYENPSIDIRIVFMRDQYLYKGSKTKYSDWCKQHGFKYAIKKMPKSWIKESREHWNGK